MARLPLSPVRVLDIQNTGGEMTNEQLYILITELLMRLSDEINKLRQQLPETMERHPMPNLKNFFYSNGDFRALDGLKSMVGNLERYQDILENRNVSRPVVTRMQYNPPEKEQ